jgi:hypothetical protein
MVCKAEEEEEEESVVGFRGFDHKMNEECNSWACSKAKKCKC